MLIFAKSETDNGCSFSPGEKVRSRASVLTILVLIGLTAPAARHLCRTSAHKNHKLRRSDIGNMPLLTELWRIRLRELQRFRAYGAGCFGDILILLYRGNCLIQSRISFTASSSTTEEAMCGMRPSTSFDMR